MNRILKQASAIGLLVLAVAIGVDAQSGQQYRAQIPFDFDAAGKHYAAGDYTVGPVSNSIAIRDLQTGSMRLLGPNVQAGTNDWDMPGTLSFQNIGDRYTLIRIRTATFKKDVKVSKTRGELAKADHATEVVVALK